MATYKSEELEQDAVRMVAAMMASSARTAPKAGGIDYIKTAIIDGDDLLNLASAMERKAEEHPSPISFSFTRDAGNVRESSMVLLIGVTGVPKRLKPPVDCGACGCQTCQELVQLRVKQGKDFCGPNCIFPIIDLGIALSSAVKLAGVLNVDTRIMYTVGAAAKKLQLLDADIIIGIPLSVTGKSPYFDRPAL
jgi:uncharacterized ferredoxin-like protein